MTTTRLSCLTAAKRIRGLCWATASLAATAMLFASWGAAVQGAQPAPPTGATNPFATTPPAKAAPTTPATKPAPTVPAAKPAPTPPPARPARPGAKKEEIPPPEDIGGRDLVTRDGVQLKATFYPSIKGKEAVPVILLHSWKGDRREYSQLADALQKQLGCAVLVPDLRGHGESTGGPGVSRPLDAAKFGRGDFERMVNYDMETLKAFLMKKNNEGQLNIEKLCVVGGEMGASVALDWARHDWSWPPLVGKKQGQDVRALVLISPELNFHGLDVVGALNHPGVRSQLSILIVVGNGDTRAVSDAKRIEGMLSRYHPEPADPAQRDLYFARLETKLQGTRMLGVQGINIERGIMAFIDRRLVQQDASWTSRE